MAATQNAKEIAQFVAKAAFMKGALDPVAIDVSERMFLTDLFLVMSADSDRGVRALADTVDEAMHQKGLSRIRREGVEHAQWVLLDYDLMVVHIFSTENRAFYGLEKLWADCPQVDLDLPEGVSLDARNAVNETSSGMPALDLSNLEALRDAAERGAQ